MFHIKLMWICISVHKAVLFFFVLLSWSSVLPDWRNNHSRRVSVTPRGGNAQAVNSVTSRLHTTHRRHANTPALVTENVAMFWIYRENIATASNIDMHKFYSEAHLCMDYFQPCCHWTRPQRTAQIFWRRGQLFSILGVSLLQSAWSTRRLVLTRCTYQTADLSGYQNTTNRLQTAQL